MRSLKHRVLITVAATLIAAALGTAMAYVLTRVVVLWMAQRRVAEGAELVQREVKEYDREAYAVLDAMNGSSAPVCSDADIGLMRKLLMRGELLHDAGRIRGGRIECSANLSRAEIPATEFKPRLILADGTSYYRNMTPYPIGSTYRASVQREDSYVVYGGWTSSYLSRYMEESPIHFAIVVVDSSSGHLDRLVGNPLPGNGAVVDRDMQGRAGEVLYVTRCSTTYRKCVAAYNSTGEILRESRARLAGGASLGGLFGALLGFFCSLLYQRSKNTEQQLRRAIQREKVRVVYQPIVELHSGQIVGAEALARWSDEEGFAVSPEVFVRIAEERGFVGAITRLVVRQALKDFGEVLRRDPGFRLSVNVSAADLADPGLVPMLEQARSQAKVEAGSMALEITETSTALHERAAEVIPQLRERGYSIHIDDFGTGYSSLAYLHELSVDAIKVDRTFTRSIGTGSVMVSIVPQILSMAEALGLGVIVEGVETEEQAEYFRATKQPMRAQGWWFGRPMPAGDFHRMVAGAEVLLSGGR